MIKALDRETNGYYDRNWRTNDDMVSPSGIVRREIIDTLGEIGTKDCIETLTKALSDSDIVIREWANIYLNESPNLLNS